MSPIKIADTIMFTLIVVILALTLSFLFIIPAPIP